MSARVTFECSTCRVTVAMPLEGPADDWSPKCPSCLVRMARSAEPPRPLVAARTEDGRDVMVELHAGPPVDAVTCLRDHTAPPARVGSRCTRPVEFPAARAIGGRPTPCGLPAALRVGAESLCREHATCACGAELQTPRSAFAADIGAALRDALPVVEAALPYAESDDGPPNGLHEAFAAFGGGDVDGVQRAERRIVEMRDLADRWSSLVVALRPLVEAIDQREIAFLDAVPDSAKKRAVRRAVSALRWVVGLEPDLQADPPAQAPPEVFAEVDRLREAARVAPSLFEHAIQREIDHLSEAKQGAYVVPAIARPLGPHRTDAEVYTCPRSGWTKRTAVCRMHPDDFRDWVAEAFPGDDDAHLRASILRDGSFGTGGGSHGDLKWIADPAVPRGDGEWTEVFE